MLAATLVGLLAFSAGPASGEPSSFFDGFDGTTLEEGWITRDGYAERFSEDVEDHAVFSVSGSRLGVSFRAGAEHNQWWLQHAQVHRPYSGSAVYEVKQDATIDGNQQFGIVFESAPGTFLMFMLYGHGQIWGYVERFSLVNGVQYKATFPGCCSSGHNTGLTVPHEGPYRLRVIVSDEGTPANRTWTFQWSVGGSPWTTVVNGVLETDLAEENIGVIESVGLFAGNQPEAFSAFDARFDWFRHYPIEEMPLEAPGGLVAEAGDGEVGLEWAEVEGAEGYRVFRSAGGGAYAEIGTVTVPSYLDESAMNGTSYGYAVSAFEGVRTSELSGAVSATPVEAPVLPAGVPAGGLVLYLDAEKLAAQQAPGTAVTSWADGSGRSHNASSVGTGAPLLVGGALGGRPAVRFDGVNDYLTLGPGFSDFTGGASIYIVARPASLQPGSKLLSLGNGAGQANVVLGRNGSTNGLQYFTTNGSGAYGWFGTGNALANGEAAVYSVLQGGGPVGGSVVARVLRDGAEVGSGTVYVPPVGSRATNFIGRSYWSSDGYFAGDIAEVIVYNRELSTAEQAALAAYLSAKYGT